MNVPRCVRSHFFRFFIITLNIPPLHKLQSLTASMKCSNGEDFGQANIVVWRIKVAEGFYTSLSSPKKKSHHIQ